MRLSDGNIRGRTIIAADGQVVGEITALVLESDAWRVESLVLTVRVEGLREVLPMDARAKAEGAAH